MANEQPDPGELNDEQREAPVVDTPQTKAQVAKELHQKRNEERAAEANELRISYKKIRTEPALLDIIKKGKMFADYHLKIAKDGVGFRDTGRINDKGEGEQEVIYFDQGQRTSELDKASGIEQLVAYIEGHITDAAVEPLRPKKVVS